MNIEDLENYFDDKPDLFDKWEFLEWYNNHEGYNKVVDEQKDKAIVAYEMKEITEEKGVFRKFLTFIHLNIW